MDERKIVAAILTIGSILYHKKADDGPLKMDYFIQSWKETITDIKERE